ncbi:MAG: PQQ-dependent sugar dehydrogenase, partial [Pirellulaceae bacterium]
MTTSITRFHLLLAGLLLVLWTIGGSADELTNRPTEGDAPALVSQRAPWTTSQITGVPDPPPYETKLVFPHLQFSKPVVLTKAPGIDRWFLAELAGRIVSFSDDSKVRQTDLFVDLAAHIDDVQHIYGMTFHPDFEQNRFVYICYLTGQGFRGDARVSRFKVTGDSPPQCDPRSEQLLLKWPTGGHNGGCLKFGPDGYLYISTGDGAAPSPPDPEAVGQNLADLKSSILRIDVDRTSPGLPYRIPEDNPFVDLKNARPEIWAYGFRNPWKMNFDGLSGDLWLGDVGWESWEMVHRIERGGNYGWSIMEGPLPIRPEAMRGPTPVQPPVVALPRSEAASVTGGQVYRGSNFPEIQGAYIFGDYETRKVWATRLDAEGTASTEEIAATDLRLITFGEDEQGELYLVDYDKGTVHQLKHREPNPEKPPFPETLSQTGLFSSTANHSLHP